MSFYGLQSGQVLAVGYIQQRKANRVQWARNMKSSSIKTRWSLELAALESWNLACIFLDTNTLGIHYYSYSTGYTLVVYTLCSLAFFVFYCHQCWQFGTSSLWRGNEFFYERKVMQNWRMWAEGRGRGSSQRSNKICKCIKIELYYKQNVMFALRFDWKQMCSL